MGKDKLWLGGQNNTEVTSCNDIEVEFSYRFKTYIPKMNSIIFSSLQEKYAKPIIKIDGVPSAFWGMDNQEIDNELKRIKHEKKG